MADYPQNEYEILEVNKGITLLRTIKPICLDKAKAICKYIKANNGGPTYWFNNIENDEIEIYVEKDKLPQAKELLHQFEHDCHKSFVKRESMLRHRYKSN